MYYMSEVHPLRKGTYPSALLADELDDRQESLG
jgi:hypothetical protein